MRRTMILGALIVGAAACESKAPATDTAQAAAPSAAPAGSAVPTTAVAITSPNEGDSVGTDVTINLSQQGLTIAKADSKHVDGVGHYHLFLDTEPTADSVVIPPTSATIVHIGTGDSTYTFKGLKPGAHRVIAVVGYGDHTPMATRRDTVNFIVKPKK